MKDNTPTKAELVQVVQFLWNEFTEHEKKKILRWSYPHIEDAINYCQTENDFAVTRE